jgi:SPP1 family predicted phage head-tail adaptor
MLPAGKLNRRVSLQTRTTTSDSGGGVTEVWSTASGNTRWARVRSLSGWEQDRANQQAAAIQWEVTLRYDGDVTANGFRILYGARVLNIRAVLPDERNAMMALLCEEENA